MPHPRISADRNGRRPLRVEHPGRECGPGHLEGNHPESTIELDVETSRTVENDNIASVGDAFAVVLSVPGAAFQMDAHKEVVLVARVLSLHDVLVRFDLDDDCASQWTRVQLSDERRRS